MVYAWVVNPRVEFNTEPWQLNETDRANYIAGVTLQYSYDSDLAKAVNRLVVLRLPGDPIQAVADTACKLASSSYVDNSSGQRAVRSMMTFYQLQETYGLCGYFAGRYRFIDTERDYRSGYTYFAPTCDQNPYARYSRTSYNTGEHRHPYHPATSRFHFSGCAHIL